MYALLCARSPMCVLICLFSQMPHMCYFMYVLTRTSVLICVASCVCSQMCAVIQVCCALMCMLTQTCALICVLSRVWLHMCAIICVFWRLCSHMCAHSYPVCSHHMCAPKLCFLLLNTVRCLLPGQCFMVAWWVMLALIFGTEFEVWKWTGGCRHFRFLTHHYDYDRITIKVEPRSRMLANPQQTAFCLHWPKRSISARNRFCLFYITSSQMLHLTLPTLHFTSRGTANFSWQQSPDILSNQLHIFQ